MREFTETLRTIMSAISEQLEMLPATEGAGYRKSTEKHNSGEHANPFPTKKGVHIFLGKNFAVGSGLFS